MRYILPALVLLAGAAAACGDDGERTIDGLVVIERLGLERERYEIGYQDRIVPPLESPYPDLVARVNGEPITGEVLTVKQVEMAGSIQQYRDLADQAGLTEENLATFEAAFDDADPLELLIDDVLLLQAAERLGYVESHEEVLEAARELDENTDEIVARWTDEELAMYEAMIERLGYSGLRVASDPERLRWLQESRALAHLEDGECNEKDPNRGIENFDPVRTGPDCSAFLAAERENADIEYFVVWAE